MTVTHRLVDPVGDAPLLHSWVTEERARFWGMTERTLQEVAEIYGYISEQEHLAAYLICDGAEPISIFQTYDPFVDEIGDYYDRSPGDVGAHFFMAPAKQLHTGQVVRHCLHLLFDDPRTERVVVEPDARNTAAVSLMRRIGFSLGPEVQLPHKPAQFAFLTRAAFEGRTLEVPSH